MNDTLDRIADEIINNLTTKKVVCPSVVQNVSTTRERQNDQISTPELPTFSRGECNESNDSFGANEDNVASSLNFENLHQREAPLIGHNNWRKKECDLLDLEGVFLARGHVMTSNSREAILDDIFRDDHVSLTIFLLS